MDRRSLIALPIFLLTIYLFTTWLFADTTGSISGLVRDKNTGETLPGVNVAVMGTSLGASTDMAGHFTILNVPAGNYTTVFSFIGYKSVEIKNVRVVPDSTIHLEIAMVVETKPGRINLVDFPPILSVLSPNATNTVRSINSEEIEKLPARGIGQIVAASAGGLMLDGSGDMTGNTPVYLQGIFANRSLYLIDGIPYNNPLTGELAGTIPDLAIKRIETQVGGFKAPYGNSLGGIIDVHTRTGRLNYSGGGEAVFSELTDPYGYHLFNGFMEGPLLPKHGNVTFFAAVEGLNAADDYPRAIKLEIPTAGISRDDLPDHSGKIVHFSGKVAGEFGNFSASFSALGSFRDSRDYIHAYAKHNAFHNPILEYDVLGGAFKFSQVISPSAYWNLTLRYQSIKHQEGDGFWYKDVLAYGDSVQNARAGVTLPGGDGTMVARDENGVFYGYGRVSNLFGKYDIRTPGIDFKFANAWKSHNIELGGSWQRSTVRYYELFPVMLAFNDILSLDSRYFNAAGRFYGYDITGDQLDVSRVREISGDVLEEAGPKKPVTASAYLQDRLEFSKLILDLGLRFDYFDPNTRRIKDPANVLGFGQPTRLDEADFETAPSEKFLSPRLGIVFPLYHRQTAFRANYGVFRRQPDLYTLYESWNNIDDLEAVDGGEIHHGHVTSETSIRYEFGVQQQIGHSLGIDLFFYHNRIEDPIWLAVERTRLGSTTRNYISYTNSGNSLAVKGIGMSLFLRRQGLFNAMVHYVFASSNQEEASTFPVTFRNPNATNPPITSTGIVPKHTFTADIDIRAGKIDKPSIPGIKLLENAGANFLLTYHSGRSYTPAASSNLLSSSAPYGNLSQYPNSAQADHFLQVDLKIDKRFELGRLSLNPYLWIQNLLGRKNIINVYPSTGMPNDTGYLQTPEGQQQIAASSNPDGFVADYKALENNPENYDLPRLIRLGLRVEL